MAGFTRRGAISLAGFLAWGLVRGRALAADAGSIGKVGALVGTATAADDSGSRPLAVGAPLHARDHVTTGAASRLEIELSDGSRMVIGESSRVVLRRFEPSASGGNALLELLEGILRIDLAPGRIWGSFDVRTYTAVASVRSTEWVVEAKTGSTAVFVVRGAVTVTDRRGRGAVRLEEGFGTDVAFGVLPREPVRWGEARAASALARTTMP